MSRPQTVYRKLSYFNIGLLIVLSTLLFLLIFPSWSVIRDIRVQENNWLLAAQIRDRFKPLFEGDVDRWKIQRAVFDLARKNPNIAVHLVDSQGVVHENYGQIAPITYLGVESGPLQELLASSKKSAPIYAPDLIEVQGRAVVSVAPISINGEQYYLYVVLASDASRSAANILREGYSFLVAGVGILLCAGASFAITAIILIRFTRRFSTMTAIVQEFAAGNFQRRLQPRPAADELDDYARIINSMAERIVADLNEMKRRDTTRRSLLSAVSRDLETPMRSIERGFQSLLNDTPGPKRSSNLSLLLRETNSLSELLADLFELARIESKDLRPSPETFSLEQLIEDVIIARQEIAESKRVKLTFVSDASGVRPVIGDITWISDAITLLVDELLGLSQPAETIECAVRHENDLLRLNLSVRGQDAEARFNEPPPSADHVSPALRRAIARAKIEAHGSSLGSVAAGSQISAFSFALPLRDFVEVHAPS